MRFDNRRAHAELGFKPRPVRRALADAIAWFRSKGLPTDPAGTGPRKPQRQASPGE
jgi:hypothetical protein